MITDTTIFHHTSIISNTAHGLEYWTPTDVMTASPIQAKCSLFVTDLNTATLYCR